MAITYNDPGYIKKSQEEAAKAAAQAAELARAEAKEFDENMKKKEEAMRNLAEIDEKMRIASITVEERRRELIKENHKQQMAELEELQQLEYQYAEDKDEAIKKQQEQYLKMYEMHKAEEDAIDKEIHEKKMQRIQNLTDKELEAASKGMEFAKKMLESSKEDGDAYRLAYKTVAISEASINAAQSILRTMAGVPYPFNIPLAAAQAVAAAVHVNKIKNAYTGGMIPGSNTLIMANEQGREAILNPMAVRAIGGEAGVNALNQGVHNYSYDNSSSSNNTIVINTAVMTQKTFRDEIEPVLKRAERRQ